MSPAVGLLREGRRWPGSECGVVGSFLAEVLGGLGLFLLGGGLASSGLGNALGGRLRERVPHWTQRGRGSFLTGLGLTTALGWSPSIGASAPALSRRWNLPAERCTLFLAGSAFALVLIPLLAWAESLGPAVRTLACLVIGGGVLLCLARPRLSALGEGLAGHGLLLLGLALLGDGFAGLPDGFTFPEVRASLLLTPLAVLAGAALGIGIGAPAAAALAVQAAAAGVASTHSSAALLVGVGASLPWLTSRIGRLGDTDDGVVASIHGALALAFALCAGLLLFWDDRLPSLLGKMPGGAPAALAIFLLAGLLAATPTTLVLARLFESTRPPAPARHAPGLAPPVHARAAPPGRPDARRRVPGRERRRRHRRGARGGARPAQRRRALAGAGRPGPGDRRAGILSLGAFESELAPVRWSGSQMVGALSATRAAAAAGRLLERLLALPPAPATSDENLRTQLALATARVGNLIEFTTRPDELPLVEDLRGHRDALELELLDLGIGSGGAEAGLVERLASLRAIVRETIEMAEARAAEIGDQPPVESPPAPEPSAAPAEEAPEPVAALPARRQRIKSVTPA